MDRLKSKQMNTQGIVSAGCENAVEALHQVSKDVTKQIGSTLQKEVNRQVTQALER